MVAGSTQHFTVASTIVAILDDDVAPITINLSGPPDSLAESSGTTTVTITAAFPQGSATLPDDTTVSVTVGHPEDSATIGTDFTAVEPFSIIIDAGDTSGTAEFDLTITDDDVYETSNDEVISVRGTASGFTVRDGAIAIRDNEPARNVNLSALELTALATWYDDEIVTLVPEFDSETVDYTASVQFHITSVTVKPTAEENDPDLIPTIQVALDEVGDTTPAVDSGTASAPFAMVSGEENLLLIKVTSKDLSTTQTYHVTVTRAAFPVVVNPQIHPQGLSDLVVTDSENVSAPLTPSPFATDTLEYKAFVDHDIASVTVTPTTAAQFSVVQVALDEVDQNTPAVPSGTASGALDVEVGDNTIIIEVTHVDATTRTYDLTVVRRECGNVDPANTGLVSDCETLLDIKDKLEGDDDDGNEVDVLDWDEDDDIATWDGVTVSTPAGETDKRVTQLQLPNEGLKGEIPTEIGDLSKLERLRLRDNNLTGSIPASLGDLANLQELQLEDNHLTGCIPTSLADHSLYDTFGINPQQDEDGNEYDLYVCSDDATLSDLTIDHGLVAAEVTLVQDDEDGGAFDPDVVDYVAEVPNTATVVTVTPTVSSAGATVQVALDMVDQNTPAVPSGTASGEIAMAIIGVNTIKIKVTSTDGMTTKTYTVDVTRPDCGNADSANTLLVADCAAMLAGKETLEGTEDTLPWNRGWDIDGWLGVTVAESGGVDRVTEISVTILRNLTGTLPEQLGELSALTLLDLSSNNITGSIPTALGDLSELEHLALHQNDLTGSIPEELDKLLNLEHLSLNNNDLSGSIPAALGDLSELTSLDLAANDLTGSIPGKLADIVGLTGLDVRRNQLTGCIPEDLMDHKNYKDFTINPQQDADGNDYNLSSCSDDATLSGLVVKHGTTALTLTPAFVSTTTDYDAEVNNDGTPVTVTPTVNFSGATVTVTFDGTDETVASGTASGELDMAVGVNTITVTVMATDGKTDKTYTVDVTRLGCGNQPSDRTRPIADCQLLLSVQDTLQGTVAEGDTPPLNWDAGMDLGDWDGITAFSNTDGVTQLDLNGEELAGVIPTEMGQLTALTRLRLDDNDLTGEIPASLGDLSDLETLNLEDNELTGDIPPELSKPSGLTALGLRRNYLTGCIPPSLADHGNYSGFVINPQYDENDDEVSLPVCSIGLSTDTATIAEDAGATTVTVTAAVDVAVAEDTDVTVSVGGGSAEAGSDFAEVDDFTVTILANQTEGSNTFTLNPTDDTVHEGAEQVAVTGTRPERGCERRHHRDHRRRRCAVVGQAHRRCNGSGRGQRHHDHHHYRRFAGRHHPVRRPAGDGHGGRRGFHGDGGREQRLHRRAGLQHHDTGGDGERERQLQPDSQRRQHPRGGGDSAGGRHGGEHHRGPGGREHHGRRRRSDGGSP